MRIARTLCAVLAALISSGCVSPSPTIVQRDDMATRASELSEIWDYAQWLREATTADVRSEAGRYAALPLDEMSTIDAMRLALLYMHDATLAAGDLQAQRVLAHVAERAAESPDIAALAQLLADSLRPVVQPESPLRAPAALPQPPARDPESELRRELETERARRNQLEQQLEALLRLEEQLDGQDDREAVDR